MNTQENFASDPPLKTTLREIRELSRSGKFWAGFAAVVVVLAISGPFDTQDLLEFPARLTYWTLISLTTLFTGLFVSYYVSFTARRLGTNELVCRTAGALLSGVPITLIVWVSNIGLFGFDMGGSDEFMRLFFYCTGIAAATVFLFYLFEDNADAKPEMDIESDNSFLQRLPKHLDRGLISLQAQDHYVKATTENGTAMVLMRLNDAEQELAGFDGLRVHRSWWVSRAHITEIGRQNDRLVLQLSNGQSVPVSRTYQKSVREALNS